MDDVKEVCSRKGVVIHSVGYSLGFYGDLDRLPCNVLKLTSMCGHGLVSVSFATKMIAHRRNPGLTPENAACYMAKFCECRIFNTARAIRILNEIRTDN